MRGRLAGWLILLAPAWGQNVDKVPAGVILVKGAWSSASDSVTPLPEGVAVAGGAFRDPYFGIEYTLPAGWVQKFEGPPPSESGRYVLGQIGAADTSPGTARGTILITAQDLFFGAAPETQLAADYQVETPRTAIGIADRPFTSFAYWSPVAEMHWYVLTTEIRCHSLQFVLTTRDTKVLERAAREMVKMKIEGGGGAPVCLADYARDENVVARVAPVFAERRFNAVPVRIVIDAGGKVKHIHFLSAFPDQARAITAALEQWKFTPYRKDGKAVEVETGMLFGR
jgi:hypothetical protein